MRQFRLKEWPGTKRKEAKDKATNEGEQSRLHGGHLQILDEGTLVLVAWFGCVLFFADLHHRLLESLSFFVVFFIVST